MLLLDCGGMFPIQGSNRKRIAELSLEAMRLMDYTAMNLGWNEIWSGTDFFKTVNNPPATFPLITSNLVYKESRRPFGEKYVIRTVGDVKVGILGVMPVEPPTIKAPRSSAPCPNKGDGIGSHQTDEKISLTDPLEIIPPEEALRKLLPEIRSKAGFVILLSQCGFEATTLLVDQLDGIDLAISGQRVEPGYPESMKTPVLEAAYMGKSLSSVKLTLDDKGRIIQKQKKRVRLSDSIPSDSRILEIMGDDIHKKIREEELRKLEKEAEVLLKLPPHEYLEMLLKEQKSGAKK